MRQIKSLIKRIVIVILTFFSSLEAEMFLNSSDKFSISLFSVKAPSIYTHMLS